ncbi:MAG: NAD-dependent malic enzyme [Verrucomicrobia bacterium]|nr:NAD-dependent malic enzyme [Verrucomicrobiota bacterium]
MKPFVPPLMGQKLLSSSRYNKGCAFTAEERDLFELHGYLPYAVETFDLQVERHYQQFLRCQTDMAKSTMLHWVFAKNIRLFYRLVRDHLKEILPILYTPSVGDRVQLHSHELRKTHGLYLNYPDMDKMDRILDQWTDEEIDLIVVTDGEGVLGIGDQGIGGIEISIAKLMVYTACGGIDPNRVLPLVLDVGTDNKTLLDDPLYLGWRHPRLRGAEYDAFIDKFVTLVKAKFPHVYLHWEDLGRENARAILDRYRHQLCTFNDDIQGTGATALASLLSALKVTGEKLSDQRIVFFGAGTAGCGIADQIARAMGVSFEEAHQYFWMVDRPGLLTDAVKDLTYFQKPYARSVREIKNWKLQNPPFVGLYDVVKNVKPTVLIGCSTVWGAFTEEIVRLMAQECKRPIIFPLSNPTSRSEAKPADLVHWTDGKALISAGSPFDPVPFGEKEIQIAQSNNAYIFPGLGLGVIAAKATEVTDGMLAAACHALSLCSPALVDPTAPLLPSFAQIEQVSKKIALAVAEQAVKDGVAAPQDFAEKIEAIYWQPKY